jgi:hypothetical protein
MRTQSTENPAVTGSPWKSLFRVGGAAALIAAVLGIIEVGIEISGSSLTSTPTNVADWFVLLQTNPVLGLAILGIFETAFFPLTGLMILGIYVALRRLHESFMAIAAFLYFVGITIYFASNNALAMLNLSNQYALATTELQRSSLLAAGQAVLATEQGTGMAVTFLFGAIAGLIISLVMLKSKAFGKSTAIVGIIANVFGLPGSALGLTVWSINGLLMLVWIVMVGIKLLQLSKNQAHQEAKK